MTYNQLTTEEFIKRAREIHGDKYDYSKAKYIDSKTPICIICPEHGEFWQISSVHFRGGGCPRCTRANNKLTMEEFIKKAREVHGNKYDYSKVENFSRVIDKVTIICPEHGEFKQRINCHLSGSGCPHCVHKSITMTTESFIERSKEIHGNKYDYSKVKYVNGHTKVCIVCPEHGEFWQNPQGHLKGNGCPHCAKNKKMTTESFIIKAREIHGNKYDYSKTEYKGSTENICIICPEHGEFWQKPATHLSGHGCPSCGGVAQPTIEEFITRAKNIHSNKYDYSKVVYKNYQTPVCIICPEHGEFWQSPASHLNGSGCPNCHGFRKNYKFNLLEEFTDEFHLRDFLMANDENMIYIILRNIEKIEPKFNPIVKDIDRALHGDSNDPIKDLEDKYRKPEEETTDTTTPTTTEEPTATSIDEVDLDDDDAVEAFINNVPENEKKDEKKEPTIEDLTKARESEIKIINEIEHMLTPEDRQFIKDKFLNDRRRDWMLERDSKKVI